MTFSPLSLVFPGCISIASHFPSFTCFLTQVFWRDCGRRVLSRRCTITLLATHSERRSTLAVSSLSRLHLKHLATASRVGDPRSVLVSSPLARHPHHFIRTATPENVQPMCVGGLLQRRRPDSGRTKNKRQWPGDARKAIGSAVPEPCRTDDTFHGDYGGRLSRTYMSANRAHSTSGAGYTRSVVHGRPSGGRRPNKATSAWRPTHTRTPVRATQTRPQGCFLQ